jgi:2-hydroxychromene-2-carboxylate isomerase
MDREIDYFFSLMSPFAYLGHDAFMAMALEAGASVNFRPCKLGQVFEATGGLPLPKRNPARQAYRLIELRRWREKRSLPLNLQPAFFPVDPTLTETCILAIVRSGGNPSPFMERVFRAVWAFDKNIADEHVVEGLLADAGHDAHAVIADAATGEVGEIHDQNTKLAIDCGVVGSPGYVLAGEAFWGQDRIELLADALASGRAPYRAD